MAATPINSKPQSLWRRVFKAMGPGLITGAADDDPSGIATYSIAGAQLGLTLLWTVPLSWPLLAAVQMMCARIGMMTERGKGLMSALGHKFPRPVLILVACALLVASTINIAANLSGMADAAQILTGVSGHIYVVVFGVVIVASTIALKYHQIANVLKWLTVILLAYVVTAFLLKPDWNMVLRATVTPQIPRDQSGWAMIVALLGTTISPYLFFWQAAEEVEEGDDALCSAQAVKDALHDRMIDIGVGTFFAHGVMFFIILTTALTLHKHGITDITSAKEAALALKPLAGDLAALLYTVGILGVAFLAIPVLASSSAYALSEVFGWTEGLDRPFSKAHAFYAVIILSVLAGVGLNFIGINPMRALFGAAVVNGLLAPFLMAGILWVASDARIMNGSPSSLLSQIVVGLATLIMFGAAVGMFVL